MSYITSLTISHDTVIILSSEYADHIKCKLHLAIVAMMMTINKEKGVAVVVLHNTTILPLSTLHCQLTNIIIVIVETKVSLFHINSTTI